MADSVPDRARVAVLSGGTSLEREVSLRSGSRVADALSDRGHLVDRIDVDATMVTRLTDGGYDAAFLCLHGSAGEDGTVQSLLELIGLPYTGPDVLSSSLAWNKPIAQGLFQRNGIRVPAHVVLSQQAFRDMGAAAAIGHVAAVLGTPTVVKPATGGSSLGLSVVSDPAQLPSAIVGAFSYAESVLIEQFITGTEVAVSILDGEALPAVEIQPKEGAYDFAARYTAGATEFHAPARLDEHIRQACADSAVKAWNAVGARHVSRADMIVDEEGAAWLLEVDTCPGLTETSLLPLAAQAAGLDFADLCERILSLALVTP